MDTRKVSVWYNIVKTKQHRTCVFWFNCFIPTVTFETVTGDMCRLFVWPGPNSESHPFPCHPSQPGHISSAARSRSLRLLQLLCLRHTTPDIRVDVMMDRNVAVATGRFDLTHGGQVGLEVGLDIEKRCMVKVWRCREGTHFILSDRFRATPGY